MDAHDVEPTNASSDAVILHLVLAVASNPEPVQRETASAAAFGRG